MKKPQYLKNNLFEEKITLENMYLPWHYPNIDNFNDFQAGYRYDSITLENLTGKAGAFNENWFVICSNYFNDPFFIDISEIENNFPVYYARHGMGIWTPIKIAESLTDFTERLKQIKIVENNREQLLEKLRSDFDLQNEFWKEVYESTLEEEE